MTLYLLNYNNYYNRLIKRKETVAEYLEEANAYLGPLSGINFVPGDGVSTTVLINHSDENRWDYLLVVDQFGDIVSRWFIIDETRVTGNQWRISLYHDLIAEWYNEVINAPVFIEKATLSADDPAIFNSEQMTFNQIKKGETFLYDRSKIAWIVGYLNKKLSVPEEEAKTITTIVNKPSIAAEVSTITNLPLYDKQRRNLYVSDKDAIIAPALSFQGFNGYYSIGWNINNGLVTPNQPFDRIVRDGMVEIDPPEEGRYTIVEGQGFTNLPQFPNRIAAALSRLNISWDLRTELGVVSTSDADTLLSGNENIYYVSDTGKYYKAKITQNRAATAITKEVSYSSAVGANITSVLREAFTPLTFASLYQVQYPLISYTIEYEEYIVEGASFTIADNRQSTIDAPYDIFCMPFGTITYNNTDTLSGDICYNIAQQMVLQLTNANVYDIQLLPYCPLPDDVFRGSSPRDINPAKLDSSQYVQYQLITSTDNKNVGIIFYCKNATFRKTIDTADIYVPTNALEIKVANECDMYRLCSPNYNGQFEFSAVKNGGVGLWNIDCTYKPFQPYIHVAPSFNKLYGKDFGDARGLVCGGDFSLPQLSDSWQEYQIQNKNFQNQFDRQIENMEVQNKYSRMSEITNAITGTFQGVAGGSMIGSMIPVPGASVIGAIGGGAISAAGGIADIYINEKLRAEALDYTKDNFGYQLGNIKALPYSLTKVGAYNANNKLVPFFERYSCTDIEKQALRDKLYYNGMSVGRIGSIAQFQQSTPTYIKGKLIRLENTGDDFHVINAISAEINKGVFI